MIVARKAPSKYRTAQRIRRELVARGMESWRVSATPTDGLPSLVRELNGTQLSIVPDADANPHARRRSLRLVECDQGELASIATFARGELVDERFPSADQFTPWDSYDGNDAA